MGFNQKAIGIGQAEVVYVSVESAIGTAATITGASVIRNISTPKAEQAWKFVDNPERQNSYSRRPRISARPDAGDVSIAALFATSGTLGTPPNIDRLIQLALGKRSITGGVTSEYTERGITDAIPSATVVYGIGGIAASWCFGTCFGKATFKGAGSSDNSGLHQAMFEGKARRVKTMYSDALLNDASISATTIEPTNIDNFQDEVRVRFRKLSTNTVYDNTNQGYRIVPGSVDYDAGTFEISPALEAGLTALSGGQPDIAIEPWLPATSGDFEPMVAAIGDITFMAGEDGEIDIAGRSFELTIETPVDHPNDVIDRGVYPTRTFSSGFRKVTLKTDAYLDPEHGRWRVRHIRNVSVPVRIKIDSPNGIESVYYSLPDLRLNLPTESGDNEKVISIEGEGYSTSALEDELTIEVKTSGTTPDPEGTLTIVDDASDPVTIPDVDGTADDFNLLLYTFENGIAGTWHGAIFAPASLSLSTLLSQLGIPMSGVDFFSGSSVYTSDPGPVLVHAGATSSYTYDSGAITGSTVGTITPSGNAALAWDTDHFEATYRSYAIGGDTYDHMGDASTPPVEDALGFYMPPA